MKDFIKKIIKFCIPLVIIMFLFVLLTIIIHKPFTSNTKKIESSKVKLNRGNYILNILASKKVEPNSFILGGSRSQVIRADSLTRKTKNKYDFFHFDSSSENIKGIEKKIHYLIEKKYELKQIIIIIDEGLLSGDDNKLPEGFHLITAPYKLTKNIILYKQYLLTFTNPRFLIGSIDYYIFNRYRNYMKRFFKSPGFSEKINPNTGDITYSAEFEIKEDSTKYYNRMRKGGHFIQIEKNQNQFFHKKPLEILNSVIEELKKRDIDYLVVLTPRHKKIGVIKSDLDILKQKNINFIDLSDLGQWNHQEGLWYENSHFRRIKIGKYIEDKIVEEIN